MLIDVFGAVVRVKTEDDKGELLDHLFEYGNKVALGDFLNGAHDFKLCDFVDGIDMVQPLGAVQVPLVDCIYPNITRLAVGLRLTSFADGRCLGSGFIKVASYSPIGTGAPQIVQV